MSLDLHIGWKGPKPSSGGESYQSLSEWQRIAQDAATRRGLTFADVIGRRRPANIVLARDEACCRIRALIINGRRPSYAMIGRWMGGRDHSTVWLAVRRHEALQRDLVG